MHLGYREPVNTAFGARQTVVLSIARIMFTLIMIVLNFMMLLICIEALVPK